MKPKTAQQHAAVRQRAQVYEAIDAPAFADDPELQGIIASVLASSNPNWVPMLSGWLRGDDLPLVVGQVHARPVTTSPLCLFMR
jgi:hypothetical protein